MKKIIIFTLFFFFFIPRVFCLKNTYNFLPPEIIVSLTGAESSDKPIFCDKYLTDDIISIWKTTLCKTLDLSNIKFEEPHDLAKIITSLPYTDIKLLNLSGHCLTFELLSLLKYYLPLSKVQILKCQNCNINYLLAEEFAELFKQCNNLFFVYLDDNQIGDEGVKILISTHTPHFISLRNNQIYDRGMINIIDNLIQDSSNKINILLLSKNNFTSKSIQYLFFSLRILETTTTLQIIDLNEASVSDDILETFVDVNSLPSFFTADSADASDLLFNKLAFFYSVFGRRIYVCMDSWHKNLSPEIYSFVLGVVNSQQCLLESLLEEINK